MRINKLLYKFHLIVDGEPEEKNLYNQIERCTNLRFLYGKKNYREDNSSNSFLMTEYPSQLILQKISFTHH